jgi:hypothetical protein
MVLTLAQRTQNAWPMEYPEIFASSESLPAGTAEKATSEDISVGPRRNGPPLPLWGVAPPIHQLGHGGTEKMSALGYTSDNSLLTFRSSNLEAKNARQLSGAPERLR